MSETITRGWYDPNDGRVYRIIDDVPHSRKLYVEQMVAFADLTAERAAKEAAEAEVERLSGIVDRYADTAFRIARCIDEQSDNPFLQEYARQFRTLLTGDRA